MKGFMFVFLGILDNGHYCRDLGGTPEPGSQYLGHPAVQGLNQLKSEIRRNSASIGTL